MYNITLSQIEQIFNKYNKSIFFKQFGCMLPTPKFYIGTAKNYLGLFSYRRSDRTGSSYKISVSKFYKMSKEEVVDTIIHEMIHEYIQYTGTIDTSTHGPMFVHIMNEINRMNPTIKVSVRGSVQKVAVKKECRMIAYDYEGSRRFTKICKTKEKNFINLLKYYRKLGYVFNNIVMFTSTHEILQSFPTCQSRLRIHRITGDLAKTIERGGTNKKKIILTA